MAHGLQPLGDVDDRDLRALVRESVRLVGALREDLLVWIEVSRAAHDAQQETLDALTVSVARVRAEQARQSAKLGLVDAEQRKARASRPDLRAHTGPDFAGLVYEGEITRVRRERAELAEIERLRLEAAGRRADMWSWVRRIAQVVVPAVALLVIAVLAAAKGWLE